MLKGWHNCHSIVAVQKLAMTSVFDSNVLKHFSGLEDPRIERSKQHLLDDIVAIAILAVIALC